MLWWSKAVRRYEGLRRETGQAAGGFCLRVGGDDLERCRGSSEPKGRCINPLMLRELYWVGQNRQVGLDLTGQTGLCRLFTLFSKSHFAANSVFLKMSITAGHFPSYSG